ncbi:MAG: hypothetical protein NC231_00200 [Bacillus sp. (in: Bacteria)]|nr:hypothetical protein [Bacillus sp. (in: firmicutes)]MCM1425576.1 hypothetical protein [Eubacterium sp.]
MTENEKLDLILLEMRGIKVEVTEMKSEITEMKSDMQKMQTEIADMKVEIADMKVEIAEIKSDMQKMQTNIEEMNFKITRIDLSIENEIRVNIQRVAEGHLDLSRDLHDAMHPNAEVEMLSLKVRMLETDVGKLKEKIS